MIYFLSAAFVIFVGLDLSLLRRRHEESFRKTNFFPTKFAILFSILIIGILIFSEEKLRYVLFFCICFLLPIYLLRRQAYLSKPELKPDENDVPSIVFASDAIGVIFQSTFWIICSAIVVKGISLFIKKDITLMGDLIISTFVSWSVILFFVYKATTRFSDKGFLYNVGLKWAQQSKTKIILIAVVLGLSFAACSSYIILNRDVQPETPFSEVMKSIDSVWFLMIFLCLAVAVAPLTEEILFRGYFYKVLYLHKGQWFALVVISLSFAILHVGQYWGDWLAIAMVTFIGFALTGLRAWSKTTIASAIMHYVYNAGVIIIPVIVMSVTHSAFIEYKIKESQMNRKEKMTMLYKAIDQTPDFSEIYVELAKIYKDEGNVIKALEMIDRALDLDPGTKRFLNLKEEILE